MIIVCVFMIKTPLDEMKEAQLDELRLRDMERDWRYFVLR
jgi:hypothetical protein